MTRPSSFRRFVGLFGLVSACALSMGGSCLNPCQQLSDKICSCEPTEFERQSCRTQSTTQQNQRQLTNDDRLFCQKTLVECECRALAEGRLEVCGLSRE